jgi:hypothetical protein
MGEYFMKIINVLSVLMVAGFLLFGCQKTGEKAPTETAAPTPLGEPETTAAIPEDVDIGAEHTSAKANETIQPGSVEKAEGGQTVEEIYLKKAELSGKKVSVHGKVVKYNSGIMGSNWIHLQDGTGSSAEGTNDLTITTQGEANVGDMVLVSGMLTTDKDFGAGYKYDVIIEDAAVTKD